MSTLLRIQEVTKNFGSITALDRVSLEIGEHERVGLIGPNGAGKTTFFNCMLGVIPMDQGHVELAGEDLTNLPVHRRAKAGIGRTFQRTEMFTDSTVRDHLVIAERIRLGEGRLWKDFLGLGGTTATELKRSDEVLELLGLRDLADEPIERLSLGQCRLVEVGRALMTLPKLLLLDEPSSGLDRAESDSLAETLREVQDDQGFSVLFVEHDVELVSSFTTRCYVLDFGRVITEGSTQDVLASDVVRRAYLGDLEVNNA